MKITIK